MSLNDPTTILVIAVLIFYARLFWLQWKRAGLERKLNQSLAANDKKRNKKEDQPRQPVYLNLSFRVTNWWLAGGGVLFLVAGFVFKFVPYFDQAFAVNPWWMAMSLGIVMLGFSYN